MTEPRQVLDEAIRRSEKRGTYYWYFLAKRGKARRREYLVEARIDLPPEQMEGCLPPPGWTAERVDVERGMVFMRRHQALRDKDLREMFATVLTYAFERGGRFHSWIHSDPDRHLEDRFERRARRLAKRPL